jgi:hypothetical protein
MRADGVRYRALAETLRVMFYLVHYQKRSDSLFGMFGIFAFAMGCLYLIYDKLGENGNTASMRRRLAATGTLAGSWPPYIPRSSSA